MKVTAMGSSQPKRTALALVLALSLAAASCATSNVETYPDSGPATVAQSDPSTDQAEGDSEPASEDPEPASEDSDSASEEEHFFPSLATTNIATGSTIDLAEELAGGDTPILLWFFAPH